FAEPRVTPRPSRDSLGGPVLSRGDAAGTRASTRGGTDPRRPPATRASPVAFALLGGVVAAATGGGWFVYHRRADQGQEIKAPEPPPPSPQTTLPPSPPEPPPRDSRATRAAGAAFDSGDYDEAVRQAQTALREDPNNEEARTVLDKALAGQNARRHFLAAESALGRGDFDAATEQAEAGGKAAPWDSRARELGTRIQTARLKAQQEAARHS